MENYRDAVAWVEIPVIDFDKAREFYSAIYDYEMPEIVMGPNRMGFLIFDREGGGIGAAIVKGEEYIPSTQGVKVYLNGGNDLNVVLDRVEAAGGKVLLPKVQLSPELGCFAVFKDVEGNLISLHSPN